MSLGFTVKIDTRDVQALMSSLPSKIVIPATVRALNKTAANVRTSASTAIRKRISLSAAVVRDGIVIRKATKDKLQSSLVISGKPIDLKNFKAKQTKRGVTVAIKPGKRTLYRGTFIISESAGPQRKGSRQNRVTKLGGNVFKRQGKSRLSITKLVGPSLPTVFSTDEVSSQTLASAKEFLPKRLAEEIRFELIRIERKR